MVLIIVIDIMVAHALEENISKILWIFEVHVLDRNEVICVHFVIELLGHQRELSKRGENG